MVSTILSIRFYYLHIPGFQSLGDVKSNLRCSLITILYVPGTRLRIGMEMLKGFDVLLAPLAVARAIRKTFMCLYMVGGSMRTDRLLQIAGIVPSSFKVGVFASPFSRIST